MDLNDLVGERSRYRSLCLAENSRKVYRTGVNQYRRFCGSVGMPPFPLNQQCLELFCTWLARSVRYKTIKVYLCGVQIDSILSGFDDLIRHMLGLRYLLRGIKRAQGLVHVRPVRVPVTRAMLGEVIRGVGMFYPFGDAQMLVAALSLAFFGLLRVSEYTSPGENLWLPDATLSIHDVGVDWVRQVVMVRLKVSKTDPFRSGVTVRVCATGSEVCPYASMVRYLGVRGPGVGPLFRFRDGRFLSRGHVAGVLQRFLPHYQVNTHSLRKGGATALAHLGVPPYVIQALGRWASDAYLTYIGLSDDFVRGVQQGMSRGGFSP